MYQKKTEDEEFSWLLSAQRQARMIRDFCSSSFTNLIYNFVQFHFACHFDDEVLRVFVCVCVCVCLYLLSIC